MRKRSRTNRLLFKTGTRLDLPYYTIILVSGTFGPCKNGYITLLSTCHESVVEKLSKMRVLRVLANCFRILTVAANTINAKWYRLL